MDSKFIGDSSNLNLEKSNFNLFPKDTPSDDNSSSSFISGLNISAAPYFGIGNDENNLKESQKKNFSNNSIESHINKKNYSDEKSKDKNNIDLNLLLDYIYSGYIPFFIKIEDYKPLYFIAYKEIIFKYILKIYSSENDNINISNYIFYNHGEKINKNMSLEKLNFEPFSIIIGKREKNNIRKKKYLLKK